MTAHRPSATGAGLQARSTLRLQLHAGYTLDDARRDLPYFARLGVTHLYLSPVTRARAGSLHGYDVVDHREVDDERGGEPALRRLADAAHQQGVGLLLDIVPNHMATDPENAWWWDVLTHGPRSRYARWFDIDWEA
ncbi:MAG: malto-oligosyltrehalose synthase, partial [Chloroflexi bacterium]|nr:malto-oligosyltrehalose synthase [Chloroflexota bacterium]